MGRIEQIDGGFVDWMPGDLAGDVVRVWPEPIGKVMREPDGSWTAIHTKSTYTVRNVKTASEAVAWLQGAAAAWRGR
jgi:hypothetical protein